MVSYKGLTYRGNAPFIYVQIPPHMSYKVVVKRNALYRFLPEELPRSEVTIRYYESLRGLGVHLVPDTAPEVTPQVPAPVDESVPASNGDVKLEKTTEIGVDTELHSKQLSEQDDARLVNQVKSELTDEALMEYLDSNFTENQLKDLAVKFKIELTQSSESLSVQLVSKKNTEFLKFISTQL